MYTYHLTPSDSSNEKTANARSWKANRLVEKSFQVRQRNLNSASEKTYFNYISTQIQIVVEQFLEENSKVDLLPRKKDIETKYVYI